MTRDEFREWFRRHCAAFTGLGSWFSKLPTDSQSLAGASQSGTLGSWYEALRDIEQADALEATRLMFREESDVHFDKHPALIRRLASRLAGTRNRATIARSLVTDNPRVRCAECLDSGHRRVVHARSVQDAIKGLQGYLYDAVVACTCVIGDERFPTKDGEKPYPRYDARKHCLLEVQGDDGWRMATEPEKRQLLAEWIAAWRERRKTSEYADAWEPANGADYQTVISNGFEGY